MKVLIIPDVHLKPWMFGDAEKIFLEKKADRVICLGDLLDDWGCEYDDQLYWDTLDAAVDFATRYRDTLWCHGNHDLAYVWNTWVSGTSSDLLTREAACNGLKDLFSAIPDGNLAYVHRIDNVLFSHGGISRKFVKKRVDESLEKDVDQVIAEINGLKLENMWGDDSPLWLRPQRAFTRYPVEMYREDMLQVVGHSPMRKITRENNLLSCDVFSLDWERQPLGTQEFCLLDTVTWEWEGTR